MVNIVTTIPTAYVDPYHDYHCYCISTVMQTPPTSQVRPSVILLLRIAGNFKATNLAWYPVA